MEHRKALMKCWFWSFLGNLGKTLGIAVQNIESWKATSWQSDLRSFFKELKHKLHVPCVNYMQSIETIY